MNPKKGCSVTMVAAEEGCYSIPITQRPSDHGRLCAEHELEAASSLQSLPPSSMAPSPMGFVDKIREGNNNMKRKKIDRVTMNPILILCVLSYKTFVMGQIMHWMTFYYLPVGVGEPRFVYCNWKNKYLFCFFSL